MKKENTGINSILAKNLFFLRDRKGVTQKQVAVYIDTTSDSISKYEKGEREPSKIKLEALSAYYGVSVDALQNHEITEDFLAERNKQIEEEKLILLSETMLFKISSDHAQANKKFSKAWNYLDKILHSQYPMETMIRESKRLFFEAFKEDKLLEGAINTLFVIFYEYSFIIKLDPLQRKIEDNNLRYDDIYVDIEKLDEKRRPFLDSFIAENETIIDECIYTLKRDSTTSDIADFYTALKYIVALVNNNNSFDDNLKTGTFMLLEFSKHGNEYATKLLAVILDLMQLI